MMSLDRWTRRYIAPFFSTCRILRAPLFVSLLAFVMLSMLPPTREVYRVLADDYTSKVGKSRSDSWRCFLPVASYGIAHAR
jgi:hypothetical protein